MSRRYKEGFYYYFAFKMQPILVPELGIELREQYGYLRMYNPISLKYDSKHHDMLLTSIYNFFTDDIVKEIATIEKNRFFIDNTLTTTPRIKDKSEKFVKLGRQPTSIKTIEEIPSQKSCNKYDNTPIHNRKFYLELRAGMEFQWWDSYPIPYSEAKGLEWVIGSIDFSMNGIIYMLRILENLHSRGIKAPDRKVMRAILYRVLYQEPELYKYKDDVISDAAIQLEGMYYEDFCTRYDWSSCTKSIPLNPDDIINNQVYPPRVKTIDDTTEGDNEMLDLEVYWDIIQRSLEHANNQALQLKFIIKEVRRLKPREIIRFRITTDKLLFDSYQSRLWCAAYIMNGGCSDDCFQYFRCWLISRGREVYYRALKDADSLVSEINNVEEGVYEFEEFWYAALDAYEKKTKDSMEMYVDLESMPYSETNYPEMPIDWDEDNEDDMRRLCPKLFEAFKDR